MELVKRKRKMKNHKPMNKKITKLIQCARKETEENSKVLTRVLPLLLEGWLS